MVQTDSYKRGEGRWDRLKVHEGTRQRTCVNDPWTWTMVWGLTVEVGRWPGWRGTWGKLGQL